jgi:Flp pilus assembly pilin Flp
VTALEYGLIAAIVATVIAVGFSNYAYNLKRLASIW